ncbi:hypothetical protein H9Q73_013947 [Fusarium xylarioides]|nr:hypothetical protein H9Q73_013947 [Fusarium xylarioides]
MGQRASEQWKWNSNNKAGRAWVLLVRAGDGAGWSCAAGAGAGAGAGTGTGTSTGPGARSGAPRFLCTSSFKRLFFASSSVWGGSSLLLERFLLTDCLLRPTQFFFNVLYVVDRQTFRIAFPKNVQFFISTNQTCP